MLEEVMMNLDKDGSGTLDWEELKIAALQVSLHSVPIMSESGKHLVLMRK